MIEIRPIREAEAEAFLRTLCEAFELDFDRASTLFFREPFFDLSRKWALFDSGRIVTLLTTTPLIFGWGRAIGIAGVATIASRQREGLAGQLIERVCREAERAGEGAVLLFAADTRLYQAQGFEALDRVIRADIARHKGVESRELTKVEVRSVYDGWSEQHPDRLRRDAQRWEYWGWQYRLAHSYQDGYLCFETDVLREAVFSTPRTTLPLPDLTQWYGTSLVTDVLDLPVDNIKVEMYLMGRNVPGVPQMFMTDQF